MVEGRDGGGMYIKLYIRIGISLGLERGRKVYFRESENIAIEMPLNQGRLVHIYPSPFAEASLHFFIACLLSGKDLPVVPSRESNSGLPYSKPTRT